MARSQLIGLEDKLDDRSLESFTSNEAGRFLLDRRLDFFRLIPNDDKNSSGVQVKGCADGIGNERSSTYPMENFGLRRFHPRPKSGGKDQNVWLHISHLEWKGTLYLTGGRSGH
jgi:hypothetical protein